MRDLDSFLAEVRARKAQLGLIDTPERTEAMRNRGGRRTPEKRALLRRIDERARAAGLEPIRSYY
ncbi:hypothetical protein HLH26_07315 [Gluconacetobacter sp. 1b LMG 1731]|uniref:Uncharacterized protein n=1 Tax=Gluconacetobacter dulcium TaxID=2729096 RepID=A0A7W4NSC1_9PROT|nr:hypothetical protein [Gluconacetobacter dulcium]MBB2164352.1 hypothetical protein [Gluconacetobacter dulcium]MBB2193578.1 hypothetical protein [Gluconacetobacter dulcium]